MFKYLSTAAVILATSTAANAVPVDLELSLLVDVSGSVNTSEFNLQRDGYVNAFNNSALFNDAISKGAIGSIAVNLVYWSTTAVESVAWTLIDSVASSQAFASAISAVSRPSLGGSTGIGNAIAFADPLFDGNGFEATRNVMDVSGDGGNNTGTLPGTASAAFCGSAGDNAINGITIGTDAGVVAEYANNVVCGTGSFAIAATSFDTFGAAINKKLIAEITNNPPTVPVPAAGWLLIAGLGGLGAMKRRKKSA
ncbi:putative secreted protein [Litoreibacter meonggei]|uniref:Putative secreted protein n=1 Tax=Litoreibacter meonggei TaxID=1049199 RepID=A0A497X226_9RHOB|nr:DUF1194 domain-containing protein [Litoreibacter meonggei]RLJ59466.1 putative secreted protein [Litoreibacter meonggei]